MALSLPATGPATSRHSSRTTRPRSTAPISLFISLLPPISNLSLFYSNMRRPWELPFCTSPPSPCPPEPCLPVSRGHGDSLLPRSARLVPFIIIAGSSKPLPSSAPSHRLCANFPCSDLQASLVPSQQRRPWMAPRIMSSLYSDGNQPPQPAPYPRLLRSSSSPRSLLPGVLHREAFFKPCRAKLQVPPPLLSSEPDGTNRICSSPPRSAASLPEFTPSPAAAQPLHRVLPPLFLHVNEDEDAHLLPALTEAAPGQISPASSRLWATPRPSRGLPAPPLTGPCGLLRFRFGVVRIRSTTSVSLLHGLVLLPSGISGFEIAESS
ncbi:hypothetical protein VPH35_123087 [Triticum aestivum]